METLIAGDWLRTVYLLGAVQGIFLAAVLASRRRNSVPNRVLAAAMLVFSLDLGMAVYHAAGYHRVVPDFIGLDYPLTFLYGPLLYLYARILGGVDRSFRAASWLHFLPFAVLVVYMIPFYAQGGVEKLAFLSDPDSGSRGQVFAVVNHIKIVHAVVYVGCTVLLLKDIRGRVRDTFSPLEHVTLNWLRYLIAGIVLIAAVSVGSYLLAVQGTPPVMGLDPNEAYDDYTLLAVTVFVYSIGYLGLRQPEIFSSHTDARAHTSVTEGASAGAGDGYTSEVHSVARAQDDPQQAEGKPRYAKSGMDAETAKGHLQALLDLMETEKPYRRNDLTLQDLADALSISPHNLTEVINTQLGQNFYDFVNGYRVREVQNRLRDPASANLTLLAIALEAGFNSKSSFNAVFKKHTDMTPSQYRAHVAAVA